MTAHAQALCWKGSSRHESVPRSVAILRYSGYMARGVCALQSSSFNLSLPLDVPCMMHCRVVPVPKSNDPSLPSNYRPISILSIASKLLERLNCSSHYLSSPLWILPHLPWTMGLSTWKINHGARFSWQLCMISCCKAIIESSLLRIFQATWEKLLVVFPTDLYSSTSVLTHTVFLLKIRHENNNIALASPNF